MNNERRKDLFMLERETSIEREDEANINNECEINGELSCKKL